MVSWLHCFGAEHRHNIVAVEESVAGEAPHLMAARNQKEKGARDKIPTSKAHACDILLLSRPYLLIAH
jgi:hypothetical protein